MHLFAQTTESLAGRIEILHLPPCCFGENAGSPQGRLEEAEFPTPLIAKQASRELPIFLDFGGLRALFEGQRLENFVISEVEKRRQLGMFEADQLFYYESTGGREIDLIVEEKKRVTAIEIKSTKTVSGRDIRNLREFKLATSTRKNLQNFYAIAYRKKLPLHRPQKTLPRSSGQARHGSRPSEELTPFIL